MKKSLTMIKSLTLFPFSIAIGKKNEKE